MEKKCDGCAEEPGAIKIRLPKRTVTLGMKCYEKAMATSTWEVLKERKPE